MQSGGLWDLKSQTRHDSEKPCWSRSLKGLGIAGRLRLEGLLLTHISQLIVQWIDYHLEGGKEGFRRVLRFSLPKHISVLSCVCILLPYSFIFHITTVLYCLWLRVVYLFICQLLLYSTLSIKLEKNQLSRNFNLGGLNCSCVFTYFRAFILIKVVDLGYNQFCS